MIRRVAPAALWLAGCLFLLALFRDAVATARFDDPDDLMRLQQVRDLLAGQGWFDVSQHRITPPASLSMHWSRLVDLPVAALILAARPVLGTPAAELWAATLVPLLTLGAACALLFRLAQMLAPLPAGRGAPVLAILVVALAAIDPGTLATMRPLRIDHHGWQAVCGLAVALGVLRATPRGAAVAGLAAALWTHISLEGLPFAAAAGALLGLRWALDPHREGVRLPIFLSAMTGGGLLLLVLVHGGGWGGTATCDAIAPLHLILLGSAAAGSALVLRVGPGAPWSRVALLGMVAAVAAVAYRLAAPQCAGGPFAGLDPLTYRLWYLHVAEGRPVWDQGLSAWGFALGYPLVGLAGAGLAWRAAAGEARRRWADYALLLAAATLIAATLLRAGALANLLALPGGGWLLLAGLRRTAGLPTVVVRVAASAAAGLLLLPPAPTLLAGLAAPERSDVAAPGCTAPANLAALDRLPPATILSPLNMANAVLAATHHRLVASVYHRDAPAIADVLRVFAGSDDRAARAALARRGATFLLLCPGGGELALYRREAPDGLAARLARGQVPRWLRPVALPGLSGRLWRIEPIAGAAPPQ